MQSELLSFANVLLLMQVLCSKGPAKDATIRLLRDRNEPPYNGQKSKPIAIPSRPKRQGNTMYGSAAVSPHDERQERGRFDNPELKAPSSPLTSFMNLGIDKMETGSFDYISMVPNYRYNGPVNVDGAKRLDLRTTGILSQKTKPMPIKTGPLPCANDSRIGPGVTEGRYADVVGEEQGQGQGQRFKQEQGKGAYKAHGEGGNSQSTAVCESLPSYYPNFEDE